MSMATHTRTQNMQKRKRSFLRGSRGVDASKRWSPETPHRIMASPSRSAHRNQIHITKTCWRTIERQYSIFFSPFFVYFFIYFFLLSILEASKFNFFTIETRTSVCCVRSSVHEMNKKIEIRNLLDTHNVTQHTTNTMLEDNNGHGRRTRTLGRHTIFL